MWKFLIRFLIFGGLLAVAVTFAVVYIRSLKRSKLLPVTQRQVPEQWRRLAEGDAHLAEALTLRDSLLVLVGTKRSTVGADVLIDVDAIIDPLADLVELRQEVTRCAQTLDKLDNGDGNAKSRTMAKQLKDHGERLANDAGEMVETLRSVYMDLVRGVSSTELERQDITLRAKQLAVNVRAHMEAESEVREILANLERDRVV